MPSKDWLEKRVEQLEAEYAKLLVERNAANLNVKALEAQNTKLDKKLAQFELAKYTKYIADKTIEGEV